MAKEDSEAATDEEVAQEAVTKYRYLNWRDGVSSSRSLGFRIEGLTIDGKSSRAFKSMNEFKQIQDVFGRFAGDSKIKLQYLERLRWIRSLCAQSPFFASHELIGSSLLFVHDQNSASAWLIDFEKTRPVSDSIKHDRVWELDNHEDGYLIGLNNLIQLFENLL